MVKNYQEMLSSEHSGFIRHNGICVVSVDEEKSVLTAGVTPENSNIWGGVHGGFLYAMADTAAGAFARINYGQHNVTLNGSDLPSRFCRHQILSHVGICHATAPQAVQLAVCLEGLCGQIYLCEIRFVAIDLCIRRAGVCRNLPEGKC